MKRTFLIILAFLNFCLISGQNYYSIDTTVKIGVTIIDRGDRANSKNLQILKGNELINFTPDEVKEYGFKDGRVYVSKEIKSSGSARKIFLLRLAKGSKNLYYYLNEHGPEYYIEDNTTFVKLPEYNEGDGTFRDILKRLTTDFPGITDAVKLVTYNKRSLTELVNRYNNKADNPFPFFKYGIIAGFEMTKLIPSITNQSVGIDVIPLVDFKYSGGFTIGTFIDRPINMGNTSIHAEIYFSRHSFSYNKYIKTEDDLIADKDIDFKGNVSSIKVPVLIRYSYPSKKYRPFINAGGLFVSNFKSGNTIYQTEKIQNTTSVLTPIEPDLIKKNQFGFALGTGIEYKLNYSHSVFFELRYDRLIGLSDSNCLNNSEIHLITSINF